MKYFLESFSRRTRVLVIGAFVAAGITAVAELPSWIRNIERKSAIEAAFFRLMPLPGGDVFFRRPPSETRPALGQLIKSEPRNAELYSLRALEDEQQLDFAAAEADWKSYVDNAADKGTAQLALADFYHRRVRPPDEIKTLALVANAGPLASEKLTPIDQQRSWKAFERIFGVIQAQGMPKQDSIAQYRAWTARYPEEHSLYARFLQFLVAEKDHTTANQLIADYRKRFPKDQIFLVKATAMLEYKRGSVQQGLGVYEKSFEPLWAPELVKSYFDLLRDTQQLRKFRDDAHAALVANPEDLNATARMFYYHQQQGKTDVAQQTIADFRLHKEASKTAWTSQELFTCARLLEDIHAYPESARYYFALYNSEGMPDARETAIAGLADILLTAPEMPIRFGSGELSMYRDIATMDQGPGYLNGILSLILNTTRPDWKYSEEEQRAVPYFHRSRAAELIALLDKSFPNSPRRPELHSKLLEFYSNMGESDAVIAGGREFLTAFPNASARTGVSLLMADAYARKNDTQNEFAIYDAVLQELASKAQNVPMGAAGETNASDEYAPEGESSYDEESAPQRRRAADQFHFGQSSTPIRQTGVRSPEYARVLERYLGRLAETKQVLAAIAVLRREIDRNPDDPGLYERLAVFLDQNQLGKQQEEVYRRAIAHFPEKTWHDKLARFYLRQKRDAEFEQLTRDAVKQFSGSELERYFQNVAGGGPQLYLRLNLYAHERFPHNPVFLHNLLNAYTSRPTYDIAAWEALIRQHWWEEAGLRNEFFEFLSRSGKLEGELAAIRSDAGNEKNPAASLFVANGEMWRSHFETAAPVLKVLATQYPAEAEIAHTASSVYRSLAYFNPADTDVAAGIEENFLKANPGDTETMARIGDIYADRNRFERAAPYWDRIPQVAPGQSSGYLDAATIYWDYFDFDNALQMLGRGRERLNQPKLYSYEAGAIYEGQRDYPRAIGEYLKGALDSPSGSPSEMRLLELARRPKFRDLVEQSTAKLPTASMDAVNLRVKVLEVQDRKQEMEPYLDGVVNSTNSIEQAEDIETLAQQKSLETVRQHALEKQAALTTDPVTRLQLRYQLVQLYEARKDFAAAQKNVEALYRENPKILGVVRSTVDFYWRQKMQQQAIGVLKQAAKDAYPALATRFTFEAARKMTEAKQFEEAQTLLAGLLKDSPYNGEYLAAMADTYAQAGDDDGLQKFYTDKIAQFRADTSLSAETKKSQIATLRRGLIPSLTRVKNYAGAVDQYIELINAYPEDEPLVTEAALYGLRYGRQQQLVDFYAKTVARSPRDYRWSIVLARIQTNLEQYPAAIDTYAKAIAIRPDRTDLLTARAGLEERLLRFTDAATDYEKLYQLSYKNPQWMEKVALMRAREGKIDQAVAALQTALIAGRPENANNYFEVARRLESWGALTQARNFAEQGVKTAGSELLATTENHKGAQTYVHILTRLRAYQQSYDTLQKALADATSTPAVIKQQVIEQGVTGVTDAEWRANELRFRTDNARNGMMTALQEMGSTASTYYTPEERLTFAHFAEAKRAGMTIADVEKMALPLAQSGEMSYQEALWRYEVMMQHTRTEQNLQPYIALQRKRGLFTELAQNLERYVAGLPGAYRISPLVASADAYRAAGDQADELRVLNGISAQDLDQSHEKRLFQLMLPRTPDALVSTASAWKRAWADSAADYVVENGGPALSHQVVQGRASARPPVWGKSYNALVGLYYSEQTPEINNAFVAALGDQTIGDRLGKPIDRNQQLAGDIWYYYGSRYGEYLALQKRPEAEDFLPSELEHSPATANNYLVLANYYAEAGDLKHAIADYNHTLELTPNRPAVYDSLAVAEYRSGDRAAAMTHWKKAFALLLSQINSAHVPETFWGDFGRVCDHLATRKVFGELRADAEAIVRSYLRHNGAYRSNAVLHSVYAANESSAATTTWIVDLATSANDPSQVLGDIINVSWIPAANRAPLYQRILQTKREIADKKTGLERDYAEQDVRNWEVRWIGHMVETKQYSAAASAIDSLPKQTRESQASAMVPYELKIAAQLGTLDAKISSYRNDSANAPANEILRTAAKQLFEDGDKQSARKVLEYVFARDIEEHHLTAPNFLGLAEIRLAAGDAPGALDLLHRLVVAVGEPLANLEPAASLLEKTGHNAEAIEFLEQLVKSAPWEQPYRLRLAKAKLAAGQDAAGAQQALTSIASAGQSSYDLRRDAATSLTGRTPADLGSGELNLLAASAVSATAADKPYFYYARMKAAKSDARGMLQLLQHAVMDFPTREEARVPLFRAAAVAHQNEFAVAIAEPLLQRQYFRQEQAADYTEDIVSSNDDEEPNSWNTPGTNSSKMTRSQQSEFAQMAADVMAKIGRLNEAESYYETARSLETNATRKKAISRQIAQVRSALRLERLNAGRRPILHEALEQDRIARPRLVARAEPPPKPATAAKGAKQ